MSTILQPSAQLVIPGVIDTPARPTEARPSLDATRVPYAQAEVTLPITDADLTLIERLDPRRDTRGTLTLGEQISGTSRAFDLAVQSRRVSHDGRFMTIGLGGDETLLQQYYPLTEDRTPLNYQDSLAGICNYVLRTVITLRRNLINNPAVRTVITGWQAVAGGGGAASVARTTNTSTPSAVPGNGVARLTLNTVGTRWLIAQSANVPVTPGRAYTLSGWIRGTAATNGTFVISWRNAAGGTIAESSVTGLSIASGLSQWRRYSVTAVAPPDAATARLQLGRTSGSAGDFLDLTGAMFEESAVLGMYIDGTMYGDGYDVLWEGVADASPSRMYPRLRSTPGVDANASAYWQVTNLLTEPSHEGALGWIAGTNATPLAGASPSRTGMYAARWYTNTSGETWMDTAGPIRVTPGRKYTVSTYMRSTSSIPGRFMVRFKNDAGVWLQQTFSPQKTLTTSYQRFVYTVTPPPGATQAMLHIGAIATAGGQAVWNDDVMFYEGEEEIDYFDGNTPDNAAYNYSWSGTPQQSTSTRVPVTERPLETFYWRPNTSAWQFLMTLVASFSFRLFCDEQRNWYLIDPNTYMLPGTVAVGTGPANAVTASDSIDRDDDAYCTGVSILWKWQDRWGIDQERNETAGVAGRVRYLQFDRPFPGRGLAAAILARAAGQGRVHDVNALADLAATPAMSFAATFPGVDPARARVTAVEWNSGDALMRVTGRTGNSVPDAPAAPTVTSPAAGRIVVSWSAPDDDGGFPVLEYRISVNEGGGGANIDGATSPSTTNGWGAGAKQISVAARNVYGWGPASPATPVTVT